MTNGKVGKLFIGVRSMKDVKAIAARLELPFTGKVTAVPGEPKMKTAVKVGHLESAEYGTDYTLFVTAFASQVSVGGLVPAWCVRKLDPTKKNIPTMIVKKEEFGQIEGGTSRMLLFYMSIYMYMHCIYILYIQHMQIL